MKTGKNLLIGYVGVLGGLALVYVITKGFNSNMEASIGFALIAFPRLAYLHIKHYKLSHKLL